MFTRPDRTVAPSLPRATAIRGCGLGATSLAPAGECVLDNDVCADARAIGAGKHSWCNIGADLVGVHAWFCIMSLDVWFDYTAPADKDVTFDTFDTPFDTLLSAYAGGGCDPRGPEIACNDDTLGPQSRITIEVERGMCYKIRVGAFTGADV